VLVATMRSPTTGSPDHTHLRAHLRQATTTSASDRAPIFPHARASPKRDHMTHLKCHADVIYDISLRICVGVPFHHLLSLL